MGCHAGGLTSAKHEHGVSLRVNLEVKVTPDSLTGTLIPFIKLDFTFQLLNDFLVEMLSCCHLNYFTDSSAVKQLD